MKTRGTRLCDVFSDIAVMLFAGGGRRHDAFDKAASFGAMGAETVFAPLYCRAHGPFGRIVRRVHTFDIHEGP